MKDLGTVGQQSTSGNLTQGHRAVSVVSHFPSASCYCIEAKRSVNAENAIIEVNRIVPMDYAPLGHTLTISLSGGCGTPIIKEIDDCEHCEKHDRMLLSMR